jgi:hypothetical protein
MTIQHWSRQITFHSHSYSEPLRYFRNRYAFQYHTPIFNIRRVFRCQRDNQNRISKKNRRYNGQTKKYKRTNNDLQHTYKTTDRVSRTPLKTGGEHRCSGRVSSSCSTSDTHRLLWVCFALQKDVKLHSNLTCPCH